MTITLEYNDLKIDVYDDPGFIQSTDSNTIYEKLIQADEDKMYEPTSKHAIKIFKNSILFSSAIVLASGGATGIYSDSFLIDDDNIIIRCCNKIFSLTIPDLKVNWIANVDMATCFSIHRYQESFISHGELTISRISRDGKILWSYGGADIFVCLYEGNPFQMHDTFIALTDFNGSTYEIDYDGETISCNQFGNVIQEHPVILKNAKKPWWKFG